MYDRREKKRIQKKWTKLVEHIAQEPLDARQLPRKLTVYVSAPPGYGLVPARDHFHEYVKPILVAAALDWDAIEGRREGDVRAGLAERIRKLRKKKGEPSSEPVEEGLEESLEGLRQRAGVTEWNGPAGDIIIGRHTWKEYVRGLHEGWLGPVEAPIPAVPTPLTTTDFPVAQIEEPTATPTHDPSAQATEPTVAHATDDASPTAPLDGTSPTESLDASSTEAEKAKEADKPKKKNQLPPFITTAEYDNLPLSQKCPQALGPAAVIPFMHLLGFWNFPIRMYRFLNRRQAADEIGRQTAAAVLGVYRPFELVGEASGSDGLYGTSAAFEQERILKDEEVDWHKTARDRSKDEEGKERVWLDDMVLDPRIAERMRRFALNAEVEERANKLPIDESKENSWFRTLWPEEQKGAWEGLTED